MRVPEDRNMYAGGVDGMAVDELLQYRRDNGEGIWESIKAGAYEPQPVQQVEILKDNGKTRNPCLFDLYRLHFIHFKKTLFLLE